MKKLQIGDSIKCRIDRNTYIVGKVFSKVLVYQTARRAHYEITIQGPNGCIRPEKCYVKETIREKVVPKTRPCTEKQLDKLCDQIRKDLTNDGHDLDSVCYDVAEGVLLTEPRVKAHFQNSGIPQYLWRECLADRIHG